MDELVVMRFFAEMKVRRDRVLKKMNDEVAEQNQKRRRPSSHLDAFRNHLDQRGSQHESRAQRDEVAQITPFPMPLHDDRAAEYIGSGGSQAEQDAGGDGMHRAIRAA